VAVPGLSHPSLRSWLWIGEVMVSVYACDVHGGRIRGALEGLRVTLLRPQDRFTRKLRVCPADLDQVLSTHDSEWEVVTDEGLGVGSMLCTACGSEASPGSALSSAFVYVWRRGSPMDEYYGLYCSSCGDKLIRDFGLVLERDPLRQHP